jgi:hypothetical protein
MLFADELFRLRAHSATRLSTGWTCPTDGFRIFRGAITASDRKSMSADRIRTAQPSRRRPAANDIGYAGGLRACLSLSQHRPGDVQRHYAASGTYGALKLQRRRATAAADVQYPLAEARRRRALHYSAACLTSRTCLQLPRQRNPSQVHSR